MIQDTSQRAYEYDVVPTLGERQAAVLVALGNLGEANNTEIAKELEWSINRVTPRVNELRKIGKVVEVGKRPCKLTGRMTYTWALSGEQMKLL